MTADLWREIEFFHEGENWGEPMKMEYELLVELDGLRRFLGKPVTIHEGYATSGHATNSAHYWGGAADLHVEGLPLLDQYLAAERFRFTGIGLYPHWNRPGLHLDVRRRVAGDPEARWWRDAVGAYQALTGDTIRQGALQPPPRPLVG